MTARSCLAVALVLGTVAAQAAGPDLTVKQIAQALVRATPAFPADFTRRNLRGLDLSGLDFAHARLADADFSASDLSDVSLVGSDLTGARLDLAVVLRANFAHADLSHASLRRLATSSTTL